MLPLGDIVGEVMEALHHARALGCQRALDHFGIRRREVGRRERRGELARREREAALVVRRGNGASAARSCAYSLVSR